MALVGKSDALPKNGSNNATAHNMNITDQTDLTIETLRAENQRLKEQHAFMTQALQDSGTALLNQIAEHQKAMEALGHSKTHMRKVIDLVPHAIFAKDAEGRYLLVNRAMAAACNLSVEEMEDALDTDFFNKAVEVERFRAADRAVITTGQRQVIPIETIRLMNGAVRYFNIIKIPFKFGEIPAVLGVATDITEREQARLAVAMLKDDLEERVRQRTAELEAANKELESFSYSVSHDLRSPLRGVDDWSLALLEDYGDILDEQAKGYLNQVRAEIQRMSVLIDDMLKLSRLSRDEMRREVVVQRVGVFICGAAPGGQSGKTRGMAHCARCVDECRLEFIASSVSELDRERLEIHR